MTKLFYLLAVAFVLGTGFFALKNNSQNESFTESKVTALVPVKIDSKAMGRIEKKKVREIKIETHAAYEEKAFENKDDESYQDGNKVSDSSLRQFEKDFQKSSGQKVDYVAPANPEVNKVSKEEQEENNRKFQQAEDKWKEQMDALFASSGPDGKDLQKQYEKMREEFADGRFQDGEVIEDENYSMTMSQDQIDADSKYIDDYELRLEKLLGEKLFKQYMEKKNKFNQKAMKEQGFLIDL